MVELEADDALASARPRSPPTTTRRAGDHLHARQGPRRSACAGTRVVQLDRRKDLLIDEAGVAAKFGVGPSSIPDYLALVGDSADGFPGLAGWGAKSAATVLARWVHLEDIPADAADWDVTVRGAAKLAVTLQESQEARAALQGSRHTASRPLAARRRRRAALAGANGRFRRVCAELDAPGLGRRAEKLAAAR